MEYNEDNFNELLKTATATAEQTTAMQTSIEKLEANNQMLLKEKVEAKKQSQAAIEESAKKSGDVEALEKSWAEKLSTSMNEKDTTIAELNNVVSNMTVGATASKLASSMAIADSINLMADVIQKRLATEFVDGKAIVRVLDKSGKPSAMSLDDLKAEIELDKAYAPLLIGSRSNGTGQVGTKGETGKVTMKRSDYDLLNPYEQAKVRNDKATKVVD